MRPVYGVRQQKGLVRARAEQVFCRMRAARHQMRRALCRERPQDLFEQIPVRIFIEGAVRVTDPDRHARFRRRRKGKGGQGGHVRMDDAVFFRAADAPDLAHRFEKIFFKRGDMEDARRGIDLFHPFVEGAFSVSREVESEFIRIRKTEVIHQTRGNAAERLMLCAFLMLTKLNI